MPKKLSFIDRNIQIHKICVWKQDEFSTIFNISAKSLHGINNFSGFSQKLWVPDTKGENLQWTKFHWGPKQFTVFFVISSFVSFIDRNAKAHKLIQAKLMLIFLHFCPTWCLCIRLSYASGWAKSKKLCIGMGKN